MKPIRIDFKHVFNLILYDPFLKDDNKSKSEILKKILRSSL